MRFLAGAIFLFLLSLPAEASTQLSFPLEAQFPNGAEVKVAPVDHSIVVGSAADWTLELSGYNDDALVSLAFDAAMPDHGHGMPAPARVTGPFGPGKYLVEGVRFNMHGRWVITLQLGLQEGMQSVSFELQVRENAQSAKKVQGFTQAEIALMRTLTLGEGTTDVEPDPSNRLSGNLKAQRLGEKLFFDPGLSGTGHISCGTCHEPERMFTDGLALSMGSKQMTRNSPSLIGSANGQWFYWDGRRDSLWAQALTPLETMGEMDNTRTAVVRYVLEHPDYAEVFAELLGASPLLTGLTRFPKTAGPFAEGRARDAWSRMPQRDREQINLAFAAVGKVLAAYVETLQHQPGRFDKAVAALVDGQSTGEMSAAEQRGAKLFLDVDKTHCLRCHNGPALTNHGFHSIGSQAHFLDLGRQLGLDAARVDLFNCTGAYSDARDNCAVSALASVPAEEFSAAFKVPTLRNLTYTAPYFHDGRFASLEEVMAFYRNPPGPEAGNHEAPPLALSDDEIIDLIAFLRMLSPEVNPYSSMAK